MNWPISSTETRPNWDSLLRSLYGEDVAARISPAVRALQHEHKNRQGTGPGRDGRWDHTDAWLITYADQFQRPGEPNLETLRRFYESHLADTLTGVHLLPFFPWSSDDGFSIIDYHEVDKRYGTWDDITALADQTRLMVDLVANHLSAQSDWLRAGWLQNPASKTCFAPKTPLLI